VSSLLFVTFVYPFPLDRGQNVRISNLIRACARDFELTLVTPPPTAGAHPELEQACARVVYAEEPRMPSLREVAGAAMRERRVRRRGDLRLTGAFERALAQVDPGEHDLIWVEGHALAGLFPEHRDRLVVDLDDLEHKKWWREVKHPAGRAEAGLGRRARALYHAGRFLLDELLLPRKVLHCVLCAPQEAALLRRSGSTNVSTVANGVQLTASSLPPGGALRDGPPYRLGFLGNLAYRPNRDAVELLDRDVLPRVRRDLDVTLEVIGPGADAELRAQFPDIRFLGFVDDVQGALRDLDVFVAPLRLGAGTKLKLLDAMASGLPIVTTRVGAEGLRLEHGVNALIADTMEEVADGVRGLCRDPEIRAHLGQRARATAHAHFGWEHIRDDASTLVHALATQAAHLRDGGERR
jgi:glycosyltransferase involved in cell wall biosynthesis